MNKKIILVGLFLILIGIILFFNASQQLTLTMFNSNQTAQRIILGSNYSTSIAIKVYNVSLLELTFNSTSPINLYLVNTTVYNKVEKNISEDKNLLPLITSFEGSGTLYILTNSLNGLYPYQQNYSNIFAKPDYYFNNSLTLNNGTYYAIFENKGTKNASIIYFLYNKNVKQLEDSSSLPGLMGIGGILLLIVGFILIVYSFIAKKKQDNNIKIFGNKIQTSNDEIYKLYDKIEANSKHKSKKSKNTISTKLNKKR